jgi:hypothetical protein
MAVNHKRVERLMREDNLLAEQPKAWVATSDSDHELEVYLNLGFTQTGGCSISCVFARRG